MKQYILDTNVFVRFFIKDIADQAKKAEELLIEIEEERIKGWISILVLDELIWTLENFYKLKRTEYIPHLIKLISLPNIAIIEIEKNKLIRIIELMEKNKIDFTDLYLLFISENKKVFSFDKDFKKKIQ